MKEDGLDNVHTEQVMVPKWMRGRESAEEIIDPPRHELTILGLGGTVATPPGGLEAEVLVVKSFDELRTRAADAKGRIVLFNEPYTNYAETVTYRTGSARAAAQQGAVGRARPLGRAGRFANAAHRQRAISAGRAADSGGRDLASRTRTASHACSRAAARYACGCRSKGTANRRGIRQRGRRDSRPREARRDRRARRPHRFVGRRRGRVGRRRRLRHHVGSAAPDEEAWRLAAADGAPGVVDQRRERHARRAAYAEKLRVNGDESRLRARVRFRRVRARALRVHGQPRGAKRDPRHRVAAAPLNLAETISGGGGADIDPIAQAGRAPTMA